MAPMHADAPTAETAELLAQVSRSIVALHDIETAIANGVAPDIVIQVIGSAIDTQSPLRRRAVDWAVAAFPGDTARQLRLIAPALGKES